MIESLDQLPRSTRRLLIHINNTNPMLPATNDPAADTAKAAPARPFLAI